MKTLGEKTQELINKLSYEVTETLILWSPPVTPIEIEALHLTISPVVKMCVFTKLKLLTTKKALPFPRAIDKLMLERCKTNPEKLMNEIFRVTNTVMRISPLLDNEVEVVFNKNCYTIKRQDGNFQVTDNGQIPELT